MTDEEILLATAPFIEDEIGDGPLSPDENYEPIEGLEPSVTRLTMLEKYKDKVVQSLQQYISHTI